MLKKKLIENWQFSESEKNEFYPATIPGVIHSDLLMNKLIDDPFYRANEKKLQWIGFKNWIYKTEFVIDKATFNHQCIELIFEGIDTYCDIRLNGHLIQQTDNMFRSWHIRCKNQLKTGKNLLELFFYSPEKISKPIKDRLPYRLPAIVEQTEPENMISMLNRKAQYHFGWDWAPRMLTCGIWKPVYLRAWNTARIQDVFIRQKEITKEKAILSAQVSIESFVNKECEINLFIRQTEETVSLQKIGLQKGENLFEIPFKIENPELWYPTGYGNQFLYDFETELIVDNSCCDKNQYRTGLREVALIQKPDKTGESFYFRVNGIDVFAKGADYIPMDMLLPRVKDMDYKKLLKAAKDANMNMIRVWGGGIYENDIFYEICDELGLLVWQDFMFACALYPGYDEFIESVKQEAIDNVKRIRRHPCRVLWCGNNEINHFLKTSWKELKKIPEVNNAHHSIFYELLPAVIKEYDAEIPYWPSSPSGSYDGNTDQNETSGDMHYWGVWHNKEKFENYTLPQNTPRFMSEYGFQSFPEWKTIETFTQTRDQELETPVMLLHQRHPSGNQLMRYYMKRGYQNPKNFRSFAYVSQVLQADAIKTAAEHHRRKRPHTMGTLFWQLNDCWPAASWAAIDYFGRWKALQYFARKFYQPVLISPCIINKNVVIYVISDKTKAFDATIEIQLIDFYGDTSFRKYMPVSIKPLTSLKYYTIEKQKLIKKNNTSNILLSVKLKTAEKVISQNHIFFSRVKNLKLSSPQIQTTVAQHDERCFTIYCKSNQLVKNIAFTCSEVDGSFSDNYFDMLPGIPYEVHFTSAKPIELNKWKQQLSHFSLYDAFN